MYRETSKLLMYKKMEGSILFELADIFREYKTTKYDKDALIEKIYMQMNRMQVLATRYGFDKNLWHNYIAYILATNENPFSMVCEKVGAGNGTVNRIVKNDLAIFHRLFHFDFNEIEKKLEIECFSIIEDYHSMAKPENTYNKSVSEKVRSFSDELEKAEDADDMFSVVTKFYKDYGVGKFGLNKAFRLEKENGVTQIEAITNTSDVSIDDLVGYEIQKKQLIDNTEAFVNGKKANNVLLYGDSGTGKSTCIKAILNQYYDKGLRMIEIYKHQFEDLSNVIARIKNRNYRFIIYMDDLSFEEFEIEYKYLKAVIEGGLEIKPDNVLIYATSNRRHLIRETWSDRSDISQDELHKSDTMQEKLSLVARFGVSINFSKPSKKEFDVIVKELAKRCEHLQISEEELLAQANMWSVRNGGFSGRTATQFVTYLESKYSI